MNFYNTKPDDIFHTNLEANINTRLTPNKYLSVNQPERH